SADRLVAALTECKVAFPCQYDYFDILIITCTAERIYHFRHRTRCKCVSYFGTVDCDLTDTVVIFILYLFVFLQCFPLSSHNSLPPILRTLLLLYQTFLPFLNEYCARRLQLFPFSHFRLISPSFY